MKPSSIVYHHITDEGFAKLKHLVIILLFPYYDKLKKYGLLCHLTLSTLYYYLQSSLSTIIVVEVGNNYMQQLLTVKLSNTTELKLPIQKCM